MKSDNLKLLSVDELWALHERVIAELASKIAAEKKALDERLRRLGAAPEGRQLKPAKRPYPKVFPKYRNPRMLLKRGRAAASNRAGYGHSCDPAKSWKTFG